MRIVEPAGEVTAHARAPSRTGFRRIRSVRTARSAALVQPETVLRRAVELGDLVVRHAEAGIELRVVDNLWPAWNRVVASSLECSGIRLHNALPPPT